MFGFTEPNILLVLWTLFFYNVLVFYYKGKFLRPGWIPAPKVRTSLFFMLILFAVTAFCNGDFYHYMEWMQMSKASFKINTEHRNYEIVYQYIVKAVDGNYVLFRLIVWGGAVLFIGMTAKRLRINPQLTYFVVLMMFASTYSYARATLGMSVYFLGLSFLMVPDSRKNVLSWIVGIGIILIAPLFHKSMYALVVLTPMIMMHKLNANALGRTMMVIYCLLLLGALYYVVNNLESLIGSLDDVNEQAADKLVSYTGREASQKGLGALLARYTRDISIYGGIVFIVRDYFRQKKAVSKLTDNLFKFTLAIILVSTLLRVVSPAFSIIFYRVMYMSFIPFSLLLVKGYTDGWIPFNHFKYINYAGFICCLYSTVYFCYVTYVS